MAIQFAPLTLPVFVGDTDHDHAETVVVRPQGSFVAVIQWDGAGEERHLVLIEKRDIEDFIAKVRASAELAK